MNKNLLEQDENDLLEIQPASESAFENDIAAPRFAETADADNLLEIPELEVGAARFSERFEKSNDALKVAPTPAVTQVEKTTSETQVKGVAPEVRFEGIEEAQAEIEEEIQAESQTEIQPENSEERIFQPPVEPESIGDTARKSGLAYGAAVTLFGSVIIMLFVGWLADWLLKTSPWGIIIGIVLGAVVGFYQFFKITSSIFKNKD